MNCSNFWCTKSLRCRLLLMSPLVPRITGPFHHSSHYSWLHHSINYDQGDQARGLVIVTNSMSLMREMKAIMKCSHPGTLACILATVIILTTFLLDILVFSSIQAIKSTANDAHLKPQSHRIVRFCDRRIGCDLVSYDRSAMFAAISFYNRTLWCILYDWL